MSRQHYAHIEGGMLASGTENSPCTCVLRAVPVTDWAGIYCRGLYPVYELYGVVVHCASNGKTLESGHYVNFIRCALYGPHFTVGAQLPLLKRGIS